MKQPKYLKSLLDQAYAVGFNTAANTPDSGEPGGQWPLDSRTYYPQKDTAFQELISGVKNQRALMLAISIAQHGFYTNVNERMGRENYDIGPLKQYNRLMNKYGWSV